MNGVTFEEVEKFWRCKYRILLEEYQGQEKLSIFENRETREEKKILEVFPFDRNGKLRVILPLIGKVILADWIFFYIEDNEMKFSC